MATAKKATAKKATAKKATAKKATAKKATAKKSTAKKTVAKKTVAKKTVAKKTVAKKTVAKKTVAKKSAPSKKPVVKKSPAKSATRKRVVDSLPDIPEVRLGSTSARPRTIQIDEPTTLVAVTPVEENNGGRRRGGLYLLIVLLFAGAGFGYTTFSGESTVTQEKIEATQPASTSATPTPMNPPSELVAEPTPTAAEATSEEQMTAALSARGDFIYTSTGIRVSWTTNGFDQFTSVTLKASEDGAPALLLASGDGNVTFFDIKKIDTVSKTAFTLTFTTEGSRTVKAPTFTIRGKFAQ